MSVPKRIKIGGKAYRAVMMRIEDKYECGTPLDLTLITDETMVELSDDPTKNEFIVAYVSEKMLKS